MCTVAPQRVQANELVLFNNGFSLEVVSHEVRDGVLTLKTDSGTLEFSALAVSRIDPAPPQAAASRETAHVSADGVPEIPERILDAAAYREGLDEDFVRSVAIVESGLQPNAISRKGALGLMQLMPATAAKLGVDPKSTEQNAHGGAKYLRELLLRYKGNPVLALAAYNAGPEAVARYAGVPPYPETRRYVVLVLEHYDRLVRQRKKAVQTASLAKTPSATN